MNVRKYPMFARPDTSTDISVDAFGQANPAPTSAFASLRFIVRMHKAVTALSFKLR